MESCEKLKSCRYLVYQVCRELLSRFAVCREAVAKLDKQIIFSHSVMLKMFEFTKNAYVYSARRVLSSLRVLCTEKVIIRIIICSL